MRNIKKYYKRIKNKDLFGKNIGLLEGECLDNPIQEGVFFCLQKAIVIFVKMTYQIINIK